MFKSQHWLLVRCCCTTPYGNPADLPEQDLQRGRRRRGLRHRRALLRRDLPQSLCEVVFSIGSSFSPLVKVLILRHQRDLLPAQQIPGLHDRQEDTPTPQREQLEHSVGFHGRVEGKGGELSGDEVKIITGALSRPTSPPSWR